VDVSGADGVVVVGATNQPELLDAALLRPGRLSELVLVPPPGPADRREILNVYLSRVRARWYKGASGGSSLLDLVRLVRPLINLIAWASVSRTLLSSHREEFPGLCVPCADGAGRGRGGGVAVGGGDRGLHGGGPGGPVQGGRAEGAQGRPPRRAGTGAHTRRTKP
jgi:hypothetical protein